jgi:hypothetical protein
MGFTTIPDAIRAAGKAAGEAMTALRVVDCAGPVANLAAALPGGSAAGAATAYAEAWKATYKAWCADGDQQAAALGQAADSYTNEDHAAASAIPTSDAGRLAEPR